LDQDLQENELEHAIEKEDLSDRHLINAKVRFRTLALSFIGYDMISLVWSLHYPNAYFEGMCQVKTLTKSAPAGGGRVIFCYIFLSLSLSLTGLG
jgi:hypothetical protein